MVTDVERAAFAKRLNQALDELEFPISGAGRQTQLAKMFHVSQKGARKWLVGEAMPSMARLTEMARDLGLSAEWLLTGLGPMWSHQIAKGTYPWDGTRPNVENATEEPEPDKPMITRSHDERHLVQKYRTLTEADKLRIQKILDAFVAGPKDCVA
jgi:transcriptional regulator with XRE-family HTH domain